MDMMNENDFGFNCVCIRSSTVCCDFSFLRQDLCVLEMHDFVEHSLQVAPEALELLQWNAVQRCLYLRLKSHMMAKHLVLLHNRRHVYPPGPTGSRVALSLLDMPSVVMVFDLSELVTDAEVREALEQFGVVLTIGHSRWGDGVTYAGVASGQRIVRMIIRRPIPRRLRIGNEHSNVMYSEQPPEPARLGEQLSAAVARGLSRLREVVRRMVR
ncbi:uncharacterized protein LOC126562607 [Anopheles maculipalpis]|uniref:uncharacterized protein LOC126562607 n=1 Tax=Anopheles maculipalpis TaxID=1496333 RepID=UPI0021599BD1|nr:uncharacterized protein LOC126562607 [Anopheles maculipalpis]